MIFKNITTKTAHILLLIVNLIYGANFTIAKAIMPKYIAPFGFIFLRVSISLLLYGLIYLFWLKEKIDSKDIPRFIACGFFGIAFNQLMFFKGISLTSTINASLLMITTPLITFIISKILLKEKTNYINILGIFMGTLGASILISGSTKEINHSNILGDLCIILNAISYSIYLIIAKPLMKKYNPLTVIFICFCSGFLWVALAGYQQFLYIKWVNIPTFYYLNIIFVILFATFFVYLFNIAAMKAVSPTIVSSYIYVQPLFAILISTIFTKEKMTLNAIIGGICIIFGLWLINHVKIKKVSPI